MKGCIVLSDKRMNCLCDLFKKKGIELITIEKSYDLLVNYSNAKELDFIVLPMSGLNEQGQCNVKGKLIYMLDFMGQAIRPLTVYTASVSPALLNRNWIVENLSMNEDFMTVNTMLTAEGVLSILLTQTDKSLNSYSYDVIGYGRCGKEIVNLLRKNDCNVRIISRMMDGAMNQIDYDTWDKSSVADIIINTAPVEVINQERVKLWTTKPIIIDLASRGVGVSNKIKNDYQVLVAPSLPALTAPLSAAEVIF